MLKATPNKLNQKNMSSTKRGVGPSNTANTDGAVNAVNDGVANSCRNSRTGTSSHKSSGTSTNSVSTVDGATEQKETAAKKAGKGADDAKNTADGIDVASRTRSCDSYKYKDYASSESFTSVSASSDASTRANTTSHQQGQPPPRSEVGYLDSISAMRQRALAANGAIFGNSAPLNQIDRATAPPSSLPVASDLHSHAHIMRMQKFPAKLASMLSRPEWSNIITWLPHGRSWKVRAVIAVMHLLCCETLQVSLL